MKEILNATKAEIKELMVYLRKVFDVVRIVDPYCTEVIDSQDKKSCFSVWNKNQRCDNCVSLKACADMERKSKFEVKNNDAFMVISLPIFIIEEKKLYAIEMVNNVSDELSVNIAGSSIIARTLNEFDHKIYEDALTGIYNRRFFDEKMFLYSDKKPVISKNVCFILFDVTHFKLINDTYGHQKGDLVLKRVAQFLKENLEGNTVIRIGGDEYLAILNDCDESTVVDKIKILKEKVKEICIEGADCLVLSFGAGYTITDNFTGSTEQIMDMFNEADKNMYKDKTNAKNNK